MIGYEPIVEKMVIVSGQDFSHYFGVDVDVEPFPSGTVLTLKVFARDDGDELGSWPAVTVQPQGAQVQISADDLAAIPDGSVFRVYVRYPDNQTLCWYRGRVWRRN